MHSDSGCFQPARGVIHPSFPLRGRWGRPASVGEQAPSPSLAFFCKTSLGMHPCLHLANYRPVFRTAIARTTLLQSAASEPFPVETDVPQFQKGPPQLKTIPPREKPFSARRHPYSQPKNTPIAATVCLSQHTIRRINTCGVRIFPKFRRAGASLFLVVWFSCRRTPQSLKSLGPSDRPARSRPAYSRKSNRTQHAQL